MFSILSVVIALVLSSFIAISVINKSFNAIEQEQYATTVQVIQTAEYSLARKYAALFGLEDMEFDVDTMIQMGLKYEQYLGSEKIEEIHAAIVEQQDSPLFRVTVKSRIKARRCHVNKIVSVSGLIMMINYVQVFTKSISGGNKDGEPSTSL